MTDRFLEVDNLRVPRLVYGTAWKEERTCELTSLALDQGFRGIDTANQRRHYLETGVGEAIVAAIESNLLSRDQLFLQTKFTFRQGQDDRLPYEPTASIGEQVRQSFASSLDHLNVEKIDSYLLHGPSQRNGLGAADWEAWQAMESIRDDRQVELLGISNVDLDQLCSLHERSRIKPRFVQNRCFAVTGWDREVREYCAANNIVYQGFSLLTANARFLQRPSIVTIAKRHGRTIPQVVFRFAIQRGMIALTGTTSVEHMRQDLDVYDFALDDEELRQIEQIAA